MEQLLASVNPKLLPLYHGARDAAIRKGPDYIRQAAVSFRELFTHLLREIAPQKAIAAWDATVLPAKGPTPNKARLAYVFRVCASSAAYGEMAKRDIEHVLQNFFLLEGEGVHKLSSDLAQAEFELLVIRCEFDLLMILRAHRISAGQ